MFNVSKFLSLNDTRSMKQNFTEIWRHAITRRTSQTGEAEAWSHTGTYWVVIEYTKYKHEPNRKLYEESQNWGQSRAIAIQIISTRKV